VSFAQISCYLRPAQIYRLSYIRQDRGLLGQVKSRKLKYFGHTTRHESLEKDIMLCIMLGKRRQGGQWIDDIVQWAKKAWSKW